MRLYGFAILRNGIKYDYPFLESLQSLDPIVEKTYLALGDSEDKTNELINENDRLNITHTIWDDNYREGGKILSQQTNLILEKLKNDYGDQENNWGFYLQCDEVLNEEEYSKILEDISCADKMGYDAVRFKYLHFWQSHEQIAISRKWYPHEIRAIKLKSDIKSWGDAQSFKNYKKIYESDAHIFHYGHVREESSYRIKKKDILTYYHQDDKIQKYRNKEIKRDKSTKCVKYFGTHPLVMKERIKRLGGIWELPRVPEIFILSDKKMYDDTFVKQINADKINWCKKVSDCKRDKRDFLVIPEPTIIQKCLNLSKVKNKPESKDARCWDVEFKLMLKLSEKNIGMKKSES